MARYVVRYSYRWKAEDAVVLQVGEVGGSAQTMEVVVWFSTPPAPSPAPRDLHDLGTQLENLAEIIENPLGLDRSPDFASESAPPAKVSVERLDGVPLTASVLQRFPWGKWLAAADATRRGDWNSARDAFGLEPIATDEKRPGRKGHDLAHYQKVAKRYTELRAKGDEAPAKTMANEASYNENTVRGWIRRCRELELLPPGRPGRAG